MNEETNCNKHCANLRIILNSKEQNVEWMLDATGILEKDKLRHIRS